MLQSNDFLLEGFKGRRQNDVWAVGRVLSKMAEVEERGSQPGLLRRVAEKIMGDPARACLSDIATFLSSHR